MEDDMKSKALSYGYKFKAYHWLKLQHIGSHYGRSSYPCNRVFLIYSGNLSYNKIDESANLLNGNFVSTLRDESFKIHENALNETQKPVSLMRFFISAFALPRGFIVDLCSGSGTVAVAALSLARDSYSSDIRKDQVEDAMVRLGNSWMHGVW